MERSSYQIDDQDRYRTQPFDMNNDIPLSTQNFPADGCSFNQQNENVQRDNFIFPDHHASNKALDRFPAGRFQDANEIYNNVQLHFDPPHFFDLVQRQQRLKLHPPDEILDAPGRPGRIYSSIVSIHGTSRFESHDSTRSRSSCYSQRKENIYPAQNWELLPPDSFDVPPLGAQHQSNMSSSSSLQFFNNGLEVDHLGNPISRSHFEENAGYSYRSLQK
jgi:hypothetical protein